MCVEAYFRRHCMLNQQNRYYWAFRYPRDLHERPPKVNVWCASGKIAVIRLSFGEYYNENAVYSEVRSFRRDDKQFLCA